MGTTRRDMLAALGAWPCALLAQAPVSGMHVGIHPWLQAGDSVAAEVLADGKMVGQFEYRSVQAGLPKLPAATLSVPVGTQRIQLRGTVSMAGKIARFNRTWTVRDLASISASLYDQGKSWPQRIHALEPKVKMPEGEETLGIEPAKAQAGEPSSSAAFQALEKRLGAPVPLAVMQLLADWDVRIGKSRFLRPAEMATLTELMHRDFGYPRTGKDAPDNFLSPGVRDRYARSLAVFVEVGDGMGALAWDPKGLTLEEQARLGSGTAAPATPGQGLWFWMHDEMAVKPSLLLDEDGRPRSSDAALASVFERFALHNWASPGTNGLVLDSANPVGNLLQLHFGQARTPELGLHSYNDHYGHYTQY